MKIDLVIVGVADNQKQNPGVFVPLNADNDNGSVVTNRIPATRDFAVNPIPDEDDLVRVEFDIEPVVGLSGIFVLRVSNHGRARIKLWDTATKQNEVVPSHFTHANLPSQIYIEGVREGAAEREIDLTLEYKENQEASCMASDTIKITVTPILTLLSVQIAAGAYPDLVDDPVLGLAIVSEGSAIGATATLRADVLRTNLIGNVRLTQNIRNLNNLAAGYGAHLGGWVMKRWDFAGANAGHFLLDSATNAQIPFYTLDESHTSFGNKQTVTTEDSPALLLIMSGNVLPPFGGTTEIDVTYDFRLWALWEFDDGTIYYLGQTSWSIRYAGRIIRPMASQPIYVPNANNNNYGSTGFIRDNSLPHTIVRPRANAGGASFR